jgi:hypothetical protein
MEDNEIRKIFHRIDLIREEVDSQVREPEFSDEKREREQRNPNMIEDDNDVLRRFAELIAFSENAKSDKVSNMLETDIFTVIFNQFKIEVVAKMDANTVLAQYWNVIKDIRFRHKVDKIISCAKSLVSIRSKHGSFLSMLEKHNIPHKLESEGDLKNFWQGFDSLRYVLEKENMPFFRSHISLLHFLLDIGYDCIKPDVVVMKVAKDLGIVEREEGRQNFRRTVRFIQSYCINRNIKPAVIDLYLLVYGRQNWAKKFLKS